MSGPITAEIIAVEIRPVRTGEAFTGAEKQGPEGLVVRIRFRNSDDTVDTSGWVVTAAAADNHGNTIADYRNPFMERVSEAEDFGPLTPNTPRERVLVFDKPIAKASSAKVRIVAHFERAKVKRHEFTFAVPLPR